MRARTSAISVPVSLVYAAAALSTGQPIIIGLGVIMVVAATGYLVNELQLKRGVRAGLSASPVKADEAPGSSKLRDLELGQASPGENIFAAIFVAVTAALTILLAANAVMPLGR